MHARTLLAASAAFLALSGAVHDRLSGSVRIPDVRGRISAVSGSRLRDHGGLRLARNPH